MVGEGDKAPRFEAPGSDGGLVRSSDYAGKKHVIYFYPRDFTPGCTVEADEFAAGHARFERAGVSVIGVSPDSPDSHKRFGEKTGARYALLSDADKSVARAFGVWGKKKFMGKEYEGVIRSTFLVDEDGTIFKAFRNVKPKGHALQVLQEFLDKKSKSP